MSTARAMLVPIVTHGCECGREMCATHKGIAQALADERRRTLEEAAKIICPYCNDPAWPQANQCGDHISPVTQTIFLCKAWKIREAHAKAQAQAGPEEGK